MGRFIENKTAEQQTTRRYSDKYRKLGLCLHCKKNKVANTSICNECAQLKKEYDRSYYKQLKVGVMSYYGGLCKCCGEHDIRFLNMDHIYNDGAIQRKTTKCGTGINFYRWVRDNNYPPNLQILCSACNQAKNNNKGICPHQEFNVFNRETYGNALRSPI